MTRIQIINLVTSHITDSLGGMNKEYPKLDFKSSWYDLTNDTQINEFIKDSSAIANTPGLDGFIVIGYDDTNKTFTQVSFSDSRLKDSNELDGLIIRRVDRNYTLAVYDETILGNKVSIIHIPPSFDKPHVIKNYTSKSGTAQQHRIFIRRGTTTQIATKYDIDFIAYDRKNLIPEYSLLLSMSKESLTIGLGQNSKINLDVGLVIENNGLRPVAITEIILTFFYSNTSVSFVSKNNQEERHNSLIKVSNIIVQPNSIKNLPTLKFDSIESKTTTEFNHYSNSYSSIEAVETEITLNTKKVIKTGVQLI